MANEIISTNFNEKKISSSYDILIKELGNELLKIVNFLDIKSIIEIKFNAKIILCEEFLIFKIKNSFNILVFPKDDLTLKELSDVFTKLSIKFYGFSFKYFSLLTWEDEEYVGEINYLNSSILYKLFSDLGVFKNFLFEKLDLNDIYYSKKYQRFLIKKYSDFLNIKKLNIDHEYLSYNPKNILIGKTPFLYLEKPLEYSEALNLKKEEKYHENNQS